MKADSGMSRRSLLEASFDGRNSETVDIERHSLGGENCQQFTVHARDGPQDIVSA